MKRVSRWGARLVAVVLLALIAVLAVRAWDSQRGAPLEPWHVIVPRELTRGELDGADWPAWLAAEDRVFATVERDVARALPEGDRVPENRYFSASPLHPARFQTDWNRSFVLEPEGEAR